MKMTIKRGLSIASLLAILVATTAVACETPQSKASEKAMQARLDKLSNIVMCGEQGESNTCKNLAERKRRNEDPNRLSYIYLVNWQGEPYAYWVAKGPVTSTQSQMASMDMVLDLCPGSNNCWELGEAPGDDGSSGTEQAGIFFYTLSGDEIELGPVSYILSDRPFDLPGVKELKFRE